MLSPVLTALAVIILVLYITSQYRALQRNIRLAKDSGLKYVVAPVFFQSIPWILLQETLLPLLQRLPQSITSSWLPLSLFYRTWATGYEPFERIGVDTFIIVSPAGNVLWTCDPDVVLQLNTRHGDFIKPTDMLGMLNIYGPTITASEGEEHRKYRKIASPSLNENTHHTVWNEAISQAQSMLEHWNRNGGVVQDTNHDANRFALHVLSKAFFNRPMTWDDAGLAKHPGYKLSYPEAISAVFKYNNTLFMTPRPVLNISPKKDHKLALQAYTEFKKYMEQMVADEKQHIAANQPKENGNLLQSFVIASQSTDAATHIPDPAVFGNLFIFILAGHETSANTMTFALSLLACRPNFQRALQADIDRILGDRRDPALWAYPQDYTRLMDGYIGALMNETLRLYTVLPFFPKTNPQVQTLTIDGAKHVLAANTLAMINTSAVHRHPKYWTQPSASSPTRSTEGAPYNLSSFRPEFWLDKKSPVPGSFIPFAEGFRACMGSRFARVEFCAALATICHDYEVQLIEGTGENALRNGANRVSEGVGFEMGMKMKEAMGLRFVKRS